EMISRYYTHGDLGYSYLPYMPPGVFASAFEPRMVKEFNPATSKWKLNSEAQNSDKLPDFLDFPILKDFPELRPFLGFGDRAVWRYKPALTKSNTVDLAVDPHN